MVSPNVLGSGKLPTRKRVVALGLVMGMIAINYIDRVNLSVATPTLMKELNLSADQMGVLMSAFYWSYVLVMIPAGVLLVKFGAKTLLTVSCFLWGLATAATALVHGFWSFMAVRILLGVAEGPAYPAAAQVVSVWIPKRERTLASACFDSCARVGSGIAPPLVAWLIVHFGWQASFVVTGIIAMAYSLYWHATYHEPDKHPKVSREEIDYIRQDEVINQDGHVVTTKPVPVLELFTYKKTVLLFIGYFTYTYYWHVFTSWIPAYLVQARSMDLKTMGFAAMIPFILGIIAEIYGGWFFDGLLRKGYNLNKVRRVGMAICLMGGSSTMLLAVQAPDPVWTVAFLSLSMVVYSFGASNVWSLDNDIAPYGQAGTISACKNATGNLSGLVAPLISGFLIGAGATVVDGYNHALYLVVGIAFLGGILYIANDYSRLSPRKRVEYTAAQ